ncbi:MULTISPECIES: hypothetical protein [unclassified Mesorhizobium]|uniref:hypothetical protein n=1 Tax=unclassified Mesorhizobium TaxID=325217 RepID=UPI0003CEC4F0|nr:MULTISPECIES: hypothetical protein [unclassified Mesorhizobium]ESX29494.1 hypothetical protein X765_14620 [Mesorhizobium sp. LSHC440B00]ESX43303.1 hypothetical protein X764_08400 [Mesorhizobium sp. LSHC440A00]ESY31644.1 hypothetical protein X749_09170 [Mesorhizobium sp. LNJC391B00]
MVFKLAVIGSFRRPNYPKVRSTIEVFRLAGLDVTSPSGSEIIGGEEFVRFESDPLDQSDAQIQTETLERIFSADAVYVITGPNGYVGKTTCYEIGRVIQRRQPVFFDDFPDDLPVHIPPAYVVSPAEFVIRYSEFSERPTWLYESGQGDVFDGERRLIGYAVDQKE